jgi:chromosome segregation ATPase
MSQRFHTVFTAVVLAFVVPAVFAAGPRTIKKCRDDQGIWHYGDSAAAECAHSKVTVMSEEGVTKKEIAAPPTAAELKAREAQAEEIADTNKHAAEQKKRDQLLLSTYAVEDDIQYVRDRKLAQVESQIKASNETISSLSKVLERLEKQANEEHKTGKVSSETEKHIASTKEQIASRQAEIAEKRKEQDMIRQEAASDLARYRELKGVPEAPAAAASKSH